MKSVPYFFPDILRLTIKHKKSYFVLKTQSTVCSYKLILFDDSTDKLHILQNLFCN